MSKRILSLVLALVMVLGTFGTVFAAPTDNEKVDWLIEEGLVKGYEDGTYGLDKEITRAEVATMLVRALDLEEVAKASMGFPSAFKDMNTSDVLWSRGYVTVAAAEGLIKGYEDGTFGPRKDITYAEVATMLVRVLGGLTEAEEKLAVGMNWATIYLTKAAQLGIFDGVSVADYSAKAERGTMFEMVYNAIMNKEFGNFTIVKAIVLENYRVEKLGKDEVVVEVIKEVQRANQLDTAVYERGDQEKFVIDAKVGDVENLLGKVADFTLDKAGKVVAIKEDTSYKVEIMDATATRTKFGSYTVELAERYKGTDERIYRTYYNNKNFAYEDFYSQDKDNRTEFDVEYAKVTSKNGKVLFIDAFNFDDISPVKEVNADGSVVSVYNDARDGSVKKYNLAASAKVLFVNDGNVSLGSREDIVTNDVIHEFAGGFIVRTDAAVNGTFEKVSQARNGQVFVHVDEEQYLVGVDANKRPVYSFDSVNDFYTLYAADAASQLREFRNEKVTILLDVAGNLQFIGSEIELGEFVGVVTRVVGRDIRVLKADGKTYDYSANLDTKVDGFNTGHQGLNNLSRGDLVYMMVNGDVIEVVDKLTKTSEKVTALDTRDITLASDGNKRILNDTVIFVVDVANDRYEVRTVKAVDDAYAKNNDAQAYVLNQKQYRTLSGRPGSNLDTEAHTIVFTKLALTTDAKKVMAEFDGYSDRQETEMRVIINGTRETRKVLANANVPANLKGGDIIEISETKDDKKDIVSVRLVIANNREDVYKVKSYDRSGNLVLEDRNGNYPTFFVRNTEIFGNLDSAVNVKISREKAESKYLEAVLVVNKNWDVTAGTPGPDMTEPVTYIVNDYRAAFETLILEDVETDTAPFKLADYTLLLDGMTVSKAEMLSWLNETDTDETGTVVKVTGDKLDLLSAAGKSFVKKARGTEALAEAKTILEGLTPVTVSAADEVTPVEWAEGKIANADIKVEVDPDNDPLTTAGTNIREFTLSIDVSDADAVTVSVEFNVE